MMKRLVTTLVLLSFFVCSISSLVLSLAADQAIATAADMAVQPDSASDIIIRSRTTAPADRSGTLWFGAGILALALVGIGAAVFTMKGGTEFLKQLRLFKKKQNRQFRQQPYLPPVYEPPYSELPGVRPVRRLPELPAWSDSDES